MVGHCKSKLRITYLTGELAVGHGDLHMLHHGALDVLHRLLGSVVDVQVGLDLLPVVVDLLVKGHLHVQLAGGEREALGHQGGGLALGPASGGELHLPHCQSNRVAAVRLLIGVVADENPQFVDDSQGLGLDGKGREGSVLQYD